MNDLAKRQQHALTHPLDYADGLVVVDYHSDHVQPSGNILRVILAVDR